MKMYYATLVQDLCGYCLTFVAEDEMKVREYLVEKYGNKVWCSVYDAATHGDDWLSKYNIKPIGRVIELC